MDPADALLLEPSAALVAPPDHHSEPLDDAPPVVANASAVATSVRRRSGRPKADSALALPSFIWDYFVKDASGKFVLCTLCPAQTTRFAYSGGTSTMNRHLRKKHHKYAPGKSAADYDSYARGASSCRRRHALRQPITASESGAPAVSQCGTTVAATSTSSLVVTAADGTPVAPVGTGSDSCGAHHSSKHRQQLQLQQYQLVEELRSARRRAGNHYSHNSHNNHNNHNNSGSSSGGTGAPSKKLASDVGPLSAALAAEFDPTAASFGSIAATAAASGALQFPVGFELHDAGMDAAGLVDQRFVDYASALPGAAAATTTNAATMGCGGQGGRGRRLRAGSGGALGAAGGYGNAGAAAAAAAASLKMLTHRLLQFLIAQYEPLDVSHVCAELGMLLMGGATEWPGVSGLHGFGYGGAGSGHGGSSSYGMGHAGVKLPSEETLKLALANLYYSQREILKEVVADVEVLSLSLNNWTSAFGQNVLTVSGHWISHGFRRRDCVLEVYVLPLDERVNTIALLRDVMEKWDIPPSKVAALTMRPRTPTANGAGGDDSATLQAAEKAQTEEEHAEANAIHSEYPGLAVVRCFVEELDRAVTSGLRECADFTRRCRNYVSYFIQNPSEYQIFLALQRSMGEEASAASATHTHAASFAATADGVSVSIAESGNATIVDQFDGFKEDQTSYAATGGAASSTLNCRTGPLTSTSSCNTGEALPVICDFDDRWNSTTEMMCRIVQLEPMLLRYKMGLESDTNPARRPMQLRFLCCELSSEEWATLKQLARLLERIEGLVHVSPHVYAGLSLAYPLLHSLKKHLAHAATWVTDALVATVRHTIVSKLNMDLCLSGQAPSSAYLSCLLDPRFKTLPFLSTPEKEQLIESLYHLLGVRAKNDVTDQSQDQLDPASDEGQTDEQKKQDGNGSASSVCVAGAALSNKKAAALLHEFFPLDEPATELDKLKAQVQQYLDSPSLPATDDTEHDPLEWWGRYRRSFPSLARLAKKYLCISAVSTPFQEAFTNYGQLMREKRARLDIEVAAQILFCRSVLRIPEMERIGV
ncbi:unnamed protein product [Hyaloperonospora brassicae]|uniref:BED-type domain-containing protein n=1 Tax=Hyaloperonospora brassicae TaxID=162125 RepID=A0AAV0UTR4_HYABA|nr:unnamed protein product [Hyaloperonospora brassicae]